MAEATKNIQPIGKRCSSRGEASLQSRGAHQFRAQMVSCLSKCITRYYKIKKNLAKYSKIPTWVGMTALGGRGLAGSVCGKPTVRRGHTARATPPLSRNTGMHQCCREQAEVIEPSKSGKIVIFDHQF